MNSIKLALKSAGVVYPLNWDELGSSAKDRWEENKYADLKRREARQASA